jgi:hypothetical protein
MQDIFQPNIIIQNEIQDILLNLNIEKYNYNVIHIRFGDNQEENTNYSSIILKINNLVQNSEVYLIICDTNKLNLFLINYYKNYLNIKINNNNKIHSAIINLNNEDGKNILIDFFIMSLSKNINCFSIYEHGSSFSKICSEIYNIPYSCYLLI